MNDQTFTREDRRATLTELGMPGEPWFRRAAALRVLGTAATIGWWSMLAIVVGAGSAAALVGLALALVVLVAAGAAETSATRRGRAAVAAALRTRLLDAAFAPVSVISAGDGVAEGVIELADRVAGYHARTRSARLVAAPCTLLTLAVIAVVHWPLAVLLAVATPLIPFNARIAGLAAEDASSRQLAEVRALTARLLDRFRGMRTLRYLDAIEREEVEVVAAADRLNRATNVVLRRAFVSAGVLDTVVTFAIAVAASYVGLSLLGYVHLGPHLDATSGLLVLVLCPVYFAPLRDHAAGYHEREEALAAIPALVPALVPAVVQGLAGASPTVSPGRGQPAAPATVELRDVIVGFPGRGVVLDGLDLRLEAGSMTALVGASGEGKTTLLRCIAGLRVPDYGRVLVDGGPARPGRAGWIGQHTVLLPRSLGDNIALGSPGASRSRVLEAARLAGLADVLDRLPDGLDTLVGEGGWGVSAGQARRVALARAVLRDAHLWLLDEPTAHLDATTEAMLLDELLEAARGRTVLIATHSDAVAARADRVLALNAGHLTETTQPVVPA